MFRETKDSNPATWDSSPFFSLKKPKCFESFKSETRIHSFTNLDHVTYVDNRYELPILIELIFKRFS